MRNRSTFMVLTLLLIAHAPLSFAGNGERGVATGGGGGGLNTSGPRVTGMEGEFLVVQCDDRSDQFKVATPWVAPSGSVEQVFQQAAEEACGYSQYK